MGWWVFCICFLEIILYFIELLDCFEDEVDGNCFFSIDYELYGFGFNIILLILWGWLLILLIIYGFIFIEVFLEFWVFVNFRDLRDGINKDGVLVKFFCCLLRIVLIFVFEFNFLRKDLYFIIELIFLKFLDCVIVFVLLIFVLVLLNIFLSCFILVLVM